MNSPKYQLLDCGEGRKLERFGEFVLDRPCAQAVWKKSLNEAAWREADAFFTRENKAGWRFKKGLPHEWRCSLEDVTFLLTPTDFGHVGVFPEHARGWRWMMQRIKPGMSVLNLFAYTGGATLALAKAGCEVCHLDASKKSVEWARRNAEANNLQAAPIRWIIDDVNKFLLRELRRGRVYDGIVLDPPSFGRGTNQELFKIDDSLTTLLANCRKLLSPKARFLFLTCHTPGYTPMVLDNLLRQQMPEGHLESGEMFIEGNTPLPSGSYGAWSADGE